MATPSASPLASAILARDRRAVARGLTIVDSRIEGWSSLVDALYPATGRAWRIGLTGPPGAGKSTLADGLIAGLRAHGRSVAVVGVDPTSPFTGGALLGDRLRMNRWHDDAHVFIRSVATRGALGGLSAQAEAACDVLDAAGFDVVILETVGVGQAEIDVARAADTVVVVLVPEGGDVVQAMKAGLMEIADCFCVNKADHVGATAYAEALRSVLETGARKQDPPPVLLTAATGGTGVDELITTLLEQQRGLEASGSWAALRRERFLQRVRRLVEEGLASRFWAMAHDGAIEAFLATLEAAERRPFALAQQLLTQKGPR